MEEIVITMIDYGGSNLRSAQKAFEFVGGQVQITADPKVVRQAEKLVLPGVGAFASGIAGLRQRELDAAAVRAVERGALLLGICLGMQLLFDESDEMGRHTGLGLIPGRVTRFNDRQMTKSETRLRSPLKVPHMGWNQISHNGRHTLLHGVPDGAHVYFVHSYYCIPAASETIIAQTEYGQLFASIVGRDNVYGIQFHPEKSQKVGLRILRNFNEMDL